jgi:hypothetical protein
VLRGIFALMNENTKVGWRKLHNGEHRDLYVLTNIIQAIKSMRIRRVGRAARVGEKRYVAKFWLGNPEGKISLGSPRRNWNSNY